MNGPTPKSWHHVHSAEVLRLLGVDVATGLGADEVARRQKEFGPNRVSARRGKPAWLKFLQQFNQPLVYILIAAVGVTAFLGEWVDSSVILGVVIINARGEDDHRRPPHHRSRHRRTSRVEGQRGGWKTRRALRSRVGENLRRGVARSGRAHRRLRPRRARIEAPPRPRAPIARPHRGDDGRRRERRPRAQAGRHRRGDGHQRHRRGQGCGGDGVDGRQLREHRGCG